MPLFSRFGAKKNPSDHPKFERLRELLSDEQCDHYFVMALFSDKVQVPLSHGLKVQEALSLAREISKATGVTAEKLYEEIQEQS